VPFDPEAIASGSVPGEIDYRLARRHLISEYKKGRLDRHEVCDAQPELLRAARNVGEPSERKCPICEEHNVVLLTYVFGPRMPAHGRCVTTKKEVAALPRDGGDLAAYVVEVCPACKWNHLARTFLIPGKASRRSGSARSG
jgi:hypothetical protein